MNLKKHAKKEVKSVYYKSQNTILKYMYKSYDNYYIILNSHGNEKYKKELLSFVAVIEIMLLRSSSGRNII